MAAVSIQLNLKDVTSALKKSTRNFNEFEDDKSHLYAIFRRELSRSERLERLLKHKKFHNNTIIFENLGAEQRQSFLILLDTLTLQWSKLSNLLDEGPGVNAELETSLVDRARFVVAEKLARAKWSMGHKSKAERILGRVKELNDYLRDDIELEIKYFDDIGAHETSAIEQDPDARDEGISIDINLLRIERDHVTPPRNLLLPAESLTTVEGEGSAHINCLATTLRRGLFQRTVPILLEYRPIHAFDVEKTVERATKLAMFLHQPKLEGMAVLRCLGVAHNKPASRFEYAFDASELPNSQQSQGAHQAMPGSQIRSLRQCLDSRGSFRFSKPSSDRDVNVQKPLSLRQRLCFAHTLARTLHRLHMVDWLHGNISSANIWFTVGQHQDSDGFTSIQVGNPYLFGFQNARKVEEYSDPSSFGSFTIEENLYRHPLRRCSEDEKPRAPHQMIHDIYSLGVVLLELGLGRTAIEIGKWLEHFPPATQDAGPGMNVQASFALLSTKFLPERMGDKYALVVRACLSGHIKETLAEFMGQSPESAAEVSIEKAFRIVVVDTLSALLEQI